MKPISKQLKPCPFCGHTKMLDGFDYPNDNELFRCVMCPNCAARSQCATSDEQAIKNWNERSYK